MFKKVELKKPLNTYKNKAYNKPLIKYGLTREELQKSKKQERKNYDKWQRLHYAKRKIDKAYFDATIGVVCSGINQNWEDFIMSNFEENSTKELKLIACN